MGEGDYWNAVSIPRLPASGSVREPRTDPERIWGPGSLDGVYGVAEAIAAKDSNNLYRTSCYFADLPRYRSFCALYAVMRVVDDRVDEVAPPRRLTDAERYREMAILKAWRCAVEDCLAGRAPRRIDTEHARHPDAEALLEAFAAAVRTFPTPAYLWDRFFTAMHRDLEQRRFATYREFVDYAGGAAVAPTTVYLLLIAAEREEHRGAYRAPPEFELNRCGHELGLFAYIAHILRDLADDLDTGEEGLLYLAADDMVAHGVTEESLLADLAARRAGPRLRALTKDLSDRAQVLVRQGRARLRGLEEALSGDRAFVLELVIRMYEAVLDKIARHSYDTMSGRHRLTERDKQLIADTVSREFETYGSGRRSRSLRKLVTVTFGAPGIGATAPALSRQLGVHRTPRVSQSLMRVATPPRTPRTWQSKR